MTDIEQLLDDLHNGRHVSLVDLPAMLNELAELRRLRDRVEGARFIVAHHYVDGEFYHAEAWNPVFGVDETQKEVSPARVMYRLVPVEEPAT